MMSYSLLWQRRVLTLHTLQPSYVGERFWSAAGCQCQSAAFTVQLFQQQQQLASFIVRRAMS